MLITFSQNIFTRLQRAGSCARECKSSLQKARRKRNAPVKMILTKEYYYYRILLTEMTPDEIQDDCSEKFKTARVKAGKSPKHRRPNHMNQSNIRKILKLVLAGWQ